MKKKSLIILAFIGVIAFPLLSFVSLDRKKANKVITASEKRNCEPIGGFVSSDKL